MRIEKTQEEDVEMSWDMIERSPIDIKIAGDTGIPLDVLDGKKLESWQLAEIRKMIRKNSDKSRYLKKVFAGMKPEDVQTLEDFKKLPAMSEKDLAGHENDFLAISPGSVHRMVTVPTTGTNGRKRLAFTEGDLKRAQDFIREAYKTFLHPGDRMLVMMSGGTPGSIGDVVHKAMAEIGIESRTCGPVTDLGAAHREVRDWKPDAITGIPVHMAALARYGELHGGLAVREVLMSADDVPDAICDRLRKVWHAGVFRHYGMTELCIAGGCECRADQGYHLRHQDHYFEIIDPGPEGYGELAVTTFHHDAMPLLRYRTGDIGRIEADPCACGGLFPRLCDVRGRIRNSVDFGDGRIFLRDIEEVVFSEPKVTDMECGLTICDSVNGASADVSLDQKIRMQVVLKHLPEDYPDAGYVRESLLALPALRAFREDSPEKYELTVDTKEMTGFEKIYNSKKTFGFWKI